MTLVAYTVSLTVSLAVTDKLDKKNVPEKHKKRWLSGLRPELLCGNLQRSPTPYSWLERELPW